MQVTHLSRPQDLVRLSASSKEQGAEGGETKINWLESANTQRQTQALMLTRQVTGLLQRTRLHITVTCQFLHAKNARHMLLGQC